MRIFIVLGLAVMAASLPPQRAHAMDGVSVQRHLEQDLSAQSRRRPRARIVVTPQPSAWTYPRPGYYSYPGPTGVRQCVDWYATEYRASGSVVTPQMACRWVVR